MRLQPLHQTMGTNPKRLRALQALHPDNCASSFSAQPTEAKVLAHKDVTIQIGNIFEKIREENARAKQE